MSSIIRIPLALATSLVLSTALVAQAPGDWPTYGRDPGGSRFSPLTQINRDNVTRLEIAWIYRTGDYLGNRSKFEGTPIMVAGTLYISTPLGRVSALDPVTGLERWTYDPHISLAGDYGDFTNRGVAVWRDPNAADGAPCQRRVFVAAIDARLISLDAATGHPCAGFGRDGQVDLTRDLRIGPAWDGEYEVTSPPALVGDVAIIGSAVADNQRVGAPSGVVRAYDARTGRLRWAWDPIPQRPDDPAAATWGGGSATRTGAANVWSVISADPARDLVFLPVGSASPDYYGGERPGENRYSNSIVALRASTGKVVWHFQVVHHDLWDYDVASQPVLFTMHRDGKEIPALAQGTKMGHLFILNRETGAPLFPVEERRVPASDVPGESAGATQPFPLLPAPLVPEHLTADEAFGVTDEERSACRDRIASSRSDGIFTPPSLKGSVMFPGNIGGSHWGAVAIDEAHGLIIAPTNRLPFIVTLIPRSQMDSARYHRGGRELSRQLGTPYGMLREPFLSRSRIPCNPPPWGTIAAIDMATGAKKWEVPLGYIPDLAAKLPQAKEWGSINLGGPIVTGGGLAFMAGTLDRHLMAFNTETGQMLWSGELPAGGHATPMTYEAGGRQFVVIAAGGHHEMGTPMGDYLVAFSLSAADHRPPATVPLSGTYVGELRVEEERLPVRLTVSLSGDSVGGQLAGEITGSVRGKLTAAGFEFTIEYHNPVHSCDGTLTGTADVANGGFMLVGPFHASGSCSGGMDEDGAFSFRKSP